MSSQLKLLLLPFIIIFSATAVSEDSEQCTVKVHKYMGIVPFTKEELDGFNVKHTFDSVGMKPVLPANSLIDNEQLTRAILKKLNLKKSGYGFEYRVAWDGQIFKLYKTKRYGWLSRKIKIIASSYKASFVYNNVIEPTLPFLYFGWGGIKFMLEFCLLVNMVYYNYNAIQRTIILSETAVKLLQNQTSR